MGIRKNISTIIESNALLKQLPSAYIRPIWFAINKFERNKFYELNTQIVDGYSYSGFHKKKCIFIHIPKAAGISISKSLFDNLGGGHTTLSRYELIFKKEIFEEYYKFTFVRNPASRLLSAYNFLTRGGINDQDGPWAKININKYKTFDDFMLNWFNKENIWTFVHFKPQVHFLKNRKGLIDINFIGKHETIGNDYKHLTKHLNIDVTLEHLNKSGPKENFLDYYSLESFKKLMSVYDEDITLLGYQDEINQQLSIIENR